MRDCLRLCRGLSSGHHEVPGQFGSQRGLELFPVRAAALVREVNVEVEGLARRSVVFGDETLKGGEGFSWGVMYCFLMDYQLIKKNISHMLFLRY